MIALTFRTLLLLGALLGALALAGLAEPPRAVVAFLGAGR